ncbi:MAG: 50S ribosomal protein L22 [Puniceicoccales bacterium]|jgi:large subunit ribosomal protein L22|nr:50S ribosomal protein L22 [Puniceicoccales bacterium]
MEQRRYTAVAAEVRMSPFKLRRVARTLSGKGAVEGAELLRLLPHKSARLIEKTLRSALANAENNHDAPLDCLVIRSILIEEGATMKRHVPAARGSAHPIRKRSSHIRVILANR